ncbi:MAG: hypothetical protein VX424_23600 [Actinomycetota bacterium]|nr:hypothetical protein [Actinomycetota bacterium]
MSFPTRRPKSAVAERLYGHSQLVDMRPPARVMGLRGEEAPLVDSRGRGSQPVASSTEP